MITQTIINHILDNQLDTKVGLSKFLGKTPFCIENYKRGRYEMNPTKLLQLCKVYNININDFQND